MLDRYHLEHELGTGARGAVYRGRDKETGRVVAIKLIADAVPHRHVGETHRGSSGVGCVWHLNHSHIPALYETARAGLLRYVVMEFAEGNDLRAHTQPSTLLPLPTVLSVMQRVADALQHAHEHGVVHGDVKPANIVFDAATGSVKLTDFNFASADAEATCATPGYMSPEQLCGLPLSPASDQFSMGATLYQLACGHLPFTGRSRPEIVRRTVNEPHVDIRLHEPALPAALLAVIDKALAKDVRARYPSAESLRQAIRSVERELRCDAPRYAARSCVHEVRPV